MDKFKQFVTPHCHSGDSLDTASQTKDFVKRQLEMGGTALTCTDHGLMSNSYVTYKLAKDANLIPIIGQEIYFRDDNCPILTKHGIERTDTVPARSGYTRETWDAMYPNGTFIDYQKYMHLTMHYQDHDAYLKAMKLLSKADLRAEQHGSERKPLHGWTDLEELAALNVTIGSGCLVGMVSRHLSSTDRPPNFDIALDYFNRLHHLFGERMYVELMPHICSHQYIDIVIIKAEDGTEHRFKPQKWLKTNDGEIRAEDLAKSFKHGVKHAKLMEVKHYRKWHPFEQEIAIKSVEHVDGQLQNECTDFSPNGDAQLGCNKWVYELAKNKGIRILTSDDCLSPGTIIRCTDGYKFVENVHPGDRVIDFEGNISTIEATRGFITQKQLVKVSVGGDPIEMTIDHRVWAKRVTKLKDADMVAPEWVDAGNLTKDHLLFIPAQKWIGNNSELFIDLSEYINHRWRATVTENDISVLNQINQESVSFKRKLTIDQDFSWILGFFLGDGNAHNNLSSFVAETDTYNEKLRPKLLKLAQKMGFNYDEIHKEKHSVFRIINTAFTQFLRKTCYDNNKVKVIPEWVNTMSFEWGANFVSGLMNADGSGYAGNFTLSMASLPVIGWVRDFLLSLGVYCSMSSRMTTGATKPLYTINMPNDVMAIIPDLWAEKRDRKSRAWISNQNGFWVRVKSVELTKIGGTVYDLQVSDTATYCTAAFAVHNSHFAYPENKLIQDVKLSQAGDWRMVGSYHLQTSDEAYQYFKNLMGIERKEFAEWIDNSHEWAQSFKNFQFDTKPSLPASFFPKDTLAHCKKLIEDHGRLDKNSQEQLRRLKTEVDRFHRNGKLDLLPYFFSIEEIGRLYEDEGLLMGPARGSAAGALLSFLLGITHIDPLKYDLSLDRFLTTDRILSGKLPDIDSDFGNRELLLGGYVTDVVDFLASDGTTHSVPASFKVDTVYGRLPIKEVLEKDLEFKEWWISENSETDRADSKAV